jgi:hypothetical protein
MSRKWNSALLLKRFEAAEKVRKVTSLEAMIRDLDTLVADLSQQIATEEQRTKVKDPRRAEYSMVALAAAARRNKLTISLAELRPKLAAAKLERDHIAGQVRDLESAQGIPAENVGVPTPANAASSRRSGSRGSLGFEAPRNSDDSLRQPD